MKQRKCVVFLDEVEFPGHVVSFEGIKVAHDKVKAVKSWPKPKTVQDVQAFLELTNFYQQFIKGFAGITRSLTDSMHKYIPFHGAMSKTPPSKP